MGVSSLPEADSSSSFVEPASILCAQNCQKLADFTLQQSLVLMTALTGLDFGRESTVTDESLKLVRGLRVSRKLRASHRGLRAA